MPKVTAQITTPAGRLVSGHPWDKFPVMDFNDKSKPKLNTLGEHVHERYVALAIAKNHPEWNDFWAKVQAIGTQGYNNVVPVGMSWKYTDGDDAKFASRDGFPGNHIIHMSTQFETKVVDNMGEQILEPSQCKTGDFADILVTVTCDGHTSMPSIYVAPQIIRRLGFGAAIIGGANVADMAPAPAAPAGSSVAPVGGAPMAPAVEAAAVAAALAPHSTAPVTPAGAPAVPPQAPAAPVATNPVVPAAPVPSVPPVPPAAITSPTNVMTAKAKGQTYEAMVAVGWTDAQLISEGYMIAPHTTFVNGPG